MKNIKKRAAIKAIVLWLVNMVSLLGSVDAVYSLGIAQYSSLKSQIESGIFFLLLWGFTSSGIIIGLYEYGKLLRNQEVPKTSTEQN